MRLTIQQLMGIFLLPLTLIAITYLARYKGRRPVLWCCFATVVMGPVYITIFYYCLEGLKLELNFLFLVSMWSFTCILILSLMANLKKQRLEYDQLAEQIEKLEKIAGLIPEEIKKLPDGKQNWGSLVSQLDTDQKIAESLGQS